MKSEKLTLVALLMLALVAISAQAQEKPNILVIMSDDVGITNVSA